MQPTNNCEAGRRKNNGAMRSGETITERLLTFNKIDVATIRVEISDLQLTHTRGQQARKGKATETAQRFEAEANSSDAACARLTSATIAVGRC